MEGRESLIRNKIRSEQGGRRQERGAQLKQEGVRLVNVTWAARAEGRDLPPGFKAMDKLVWGKK